jgi:hypothetical protein
MPDGRPPIAARKARETRSRVTNGRAIFLDRVDGRSALARRFRDVLTEISGNLGGSERLSEAERQLARQAATISIICERLEAAAMRGEAVDLDEYGQLTDRLGRCFQRLGISRHDLPNPARDALSASAQEDALLDALSRLARLRRRHSRDPGLRSLASGVRISLGGGDDLKELSRARKVLGSLSVIARGVNKLAFFMVANI